ncbi:hypothetical protein A2U01_0072033, partial [Trifolium medium]|nr:hypothetical protein [Trifolium medium]
NLKSKSVADDTDDYENPSDDDAGSEKLDRVVKELFILLKEWFQRS